MGAASSNFPELAALGIEVFVFPLVGAMWFNCRTYSGWAVVCTYVFFWFLIRVGFHIRDPLQTPMTPDEASQASRIYFGWYPIFILMSALVGWLICMLMDIREAIPFYAILPSFSLNTRDSSLITPCTDLDALRAYDCRCERGIQRWCYDHIEPPYWHTLVGIILALFTLILPSFLFWILLPTSKWAAYLIPLIIIVVGYVAAWLFWSYYTDLYVWGATEHNMKARIEAKKKDESSIYGDDADISRFDAVVYGRTQQTINKNVLVMGLIHLLGFALIGALIVIPSVADVDVVWITGLIFVIVVALIFIVVALLFYSWYPKAAPCEQRVCSITGRPLGSKFATKTPTGETSESTVTFSSSKSLGKSVLQNNETVLNALFSK